MLTATYHISQMFTSLCFCVSVLISTTQHLWQVYCA